MIKDPMVFISVGFGFCLISMVTYLEFNQVSGWIDSPFHDLAMPLGLGMGIASLYYGHNRMDHLENNKTFDDIQERLDQIHEDVYLLSNEIKKISTFLNDTKQRID